MVCWTVEKEIRLIDFMQAHRVLWDPREENYYRRREREAALDQLALLLGHDERGSNFSCTDIKEKIHSLRTAYNREVKKVESSILSGAEDAGYVPRWVHFSRMQFLRDVIKTRTTQDRMNHNIILQARLKNEIGQEPEDSAVPSTSDSNPCSIPESPIPRQRKRKANPNDSEAARMEIYSSIPKYLQQSVVDPNDTFGKYVADTLKGMGLWNRELCKAEIQQVMSKHLLNDLENDA
ncbi:uncharacterized protein [Hoplias malabaricus]|uniref:uncharacterized protein n=1 Tax=Hoplias malabaricus TaxID=27720 RepID=UPI003463307F